VYEWALKRCTSAARGGYVTPPPEEVELKVDAVQIENVAVEKDDTVQQELEMKKVAKLNP
jgi:hypothetical protein